MMHPSYKAWKDACGVLMCQKRRLKCYFQWYPFSILSKTDWEILSSEVFFSTYIQDGAFLICHSMRFTTKGFIQKQGIAFRDSVLVSPVLFLYLLAFGIEYQSVFIDSRPEMACEYAGNIANKQAHYWRSYQRYRAHMRIAKESYSYYLKTDISNFFGSINVDKLISKMQDCSNGSFSATDGLFLRALLLYCGEGKFPTIQNHPTLSFLATKVFLSDADTRLSRNIQKNTSVASFKLVRYVDDLFIFFDVRDGVSPFQAKEELLNTYADILRLSGLTLNQGKVEFGHTSALSLMGAPNLALISRSFKRKKRLTMLLDGQRICSRRLLNEQAAETISSKTSTRRSNPPSPEKKGPHRQYMHSDPAFITNKTVFVSES